MNYAPGFKIFSTTSLIHSLLAGIAPMVLAPKNRAQRRAQGG